MEFTFDISDVLHRQVTLFSAAEAMGLKFHSHNLG
jgi:hypothetical protein